MSEPTAPASITPPARTAEMASSTAAASITPHVQMCGTLAGTRSGTALTAALQACPYPDFALTTA